MHDKNYNKKGWDSLLLNTFLNTFLTLNKSYVFFVVFSLTFIGFLITLTLLLLTTILN